MLLSLRRAQIVERRGCLEDVLDEQVDAAAREQIFFGTAASWLRLPASGSNTGGLNLATRAVPAVADAALPLADSSAASSARASEFRPEHGRATSARRLLSRGWQPLGCTTGPSHCGLPPEHRLLPPTSRETPMTTTLAPRTNWPALQQGAARHEDEAYAVIVERWPVLPIADTRCAAAGMRPAA